MTITDVKTHLTGMLHGGTLNKVRNFEYALERAAANLLANIKPVDSEREAALTSLIYDDIYNYALPSDFGWLNDLRPQGERTHLEAASRRFAEPFDLKKALTNKQVSIEGREATKFIRVNWRTHAPIVIDQMNKTTGWSVVGSASGLKAQTLYKVSGNASLEFDLSATGQGIQKTTLSTIDLTDEDEQADVFGWIHLPTSTDVTRLTSSTVRWGNDLTANYWESAAVTKQADDSAFKVGWNLLKWLWSAAAETGTVAPATIDSFRIVFAVTGAITNIKVDALVFAVGRNFDLKYYSVYAFKNTSGTYLIRPTSDSDEVIFSGTALEIFLEEARKECAAQMEGEDSGFDIRFANARLHGNADSPDPISRMGLYAKYRVEFPSQTKRAVRTWANPRSGAFWRV